MVAAAMPWAKWPTAVVSDSERRCSARIPSLAKVHGPGSALHGECYPRPTDDRSYTDPRARISCRPLTSTDSTTSNHSRDARTAPSGPPRNRTRPPHRPQDHARRHRRQRPPIYPRTTRHRPTLRHRRPRPHLPHRHHRRQPTVQRVQVRGLEWIWCDSGRPRLPRSTPPPPARSARPGRKQKHRRNPCDRIVAVHRQALAGTLLDRPARLAPRPKETPRCEMGSATHRSNRLDRPFWNGRKQPMRNRLYGR